MIFLVAALLGWSCALSRHVFISYIIQQRFMGARSRERKTQVCCSYDTFAVKDGRGDGNEINKYAGGAVR